MGYRAPSAEDIYRYVFRLDHLNRSLTDGFGFSIVFVNDNSSVCRDFISRYFVDICHRTADRIRIIFFSELPELYFEEIARRMNSNSSSKLREDGILGAVIKSKSHRLLDEPHIELLDDFLEALRFRDYNEVDWLLSRISRVLGPRYADALYRLVREHQYGNTRDVEIRARELIAELQDSKRRLRRDPFRRIYDDHWRDLTPDSMTLIDAPERTRELSFDTKNNTAMPGVGESMRFAARLGIGRHVPCFVFFTDVGQLSVDVFPVGQLSADETYEQLRVWIDSFYEENLVLVDKWNQVEKDINALTNSVNQSLTKLRGWMSKSDQLWNELRITAQIIVKLSASISKPEAYKSVIDGLNTSSSRCKQILSECRTRLEKLYIERDNYKLNSERLQTIINNLNAASNFAKIYDELSRALREPLTSSALSILHQTINLMVQQRKSLIVLSPESELFKWWGLVRRSLPSFNKFKNIRRTWTFTTKISSEVIRSEYITFLKAVFELPFSDTPETLIEKTEPLLANIIGIDSQSNEWNLAFSEYSVQLMSFFCQLHDNTPEWLTKDGNDMKISDVIPFQNGERVNFGKILDATKEDHPLRCMIQKSVTVEQRNRQAEIASEIEKIALQCRDEVSTALAKLKEEQLDLSMEQTAAYSDCLCDIRALRNKIEKELTDIANSAYNPDNSPRLIETKDIAVFLNLLDEYEHTVNSLIYPHKRNRRVQNIKLSASLPQIFELGISKQSNRSDQRRKELEEELEETVRESKAGATLLRNVKKRSCTMTPSALLASELKKTTHETYPETGLRTRVCRVIKLILKQVYDTEEFTTYTEEILETTVENLEGKLYELNDEKLQNVWNSLAASTIEARSRKEMIDTILAIVGLIPAREQQQHLPHESDAKVKDAELAIYRQQNADLIESIKRQPNIQIINNLEAKAVAESQSNPNTFNNDLREAKIGNFANQVQDDARQQTNQYNYASPEKQTLAEAANEIQRLLKQFEETNATATEIEQVAYVNFAVKPDIKQRAIAALKAGGETAIDEFFLENKYLKVGKAVIKAWLQPNS